MSSQIIWILLHTDLPTRQIYLQVMITLQIRLKQHFKETEQLLKLKWITPFCYQTAAPKKQGIFLLVKDERCPPMLYCLEGN